MQEKHVDWINRPATVIGAVPNLRMAMEYTIVVYVMALAMLVACMRAVQHLILAIIDMMRGDWNGDSVV